MHPPSRERRAGNLPVRTEMPTYDYECPEGHRFERFLKMSDDPKASCPECGKPAQRLISGGAGFLFKGDGFYITDYRSADYRKKASAEPGASGGGKSGGDSASSGGSSSSDGGSSSGGKSSDGGTSAAAPKKGGGSGSDGGSGSSTSGGAAD